jgi:predicted phage terminase large subunit-like protein
VNPDTLKRLGIQADELRLLSEAFQTPDAFAHFVTKGKQLRPAHLQYLGRKIADACFQRPGAKRNLLITKPPRHGKSELSSWWTPTWYLTNFPERKVILTTYEAEFAAQWGRKVRNSLVELEPILDFKLSADVTAADRWEIEKRGGGMMTAGVGGAIVGKGAHLLICDDPIKNSEEALSEVYRKKTVDWWKTTFLTRREPGGVVILMHQRWHEDDLAGQICREQAERYGPYATHGHLWEWEIVNFPAICTEEDLVGDTDTDIIGRRVGEALWPERYDIGELMRLKANVGSYNFSALYQQKPVPAEGGEFKTAWFRRRYRWNEDHSIQLGGRRIEISELHVFQTVDLATSLQTWADYTVISTWGEIQIGHNTYLFLLDVVRGKFDSPQTKQEIESAVKEWDPDFVGVESKAFQLSAVQDLRALGLPIREIKSDKDKISRARAVTPYCEAGFYVFPEEAPWLTDCERELFGFPFAKHDDFVDTISSTMEFIAFGEIGIGGDIDLDAARQHADQIEKAVVEPGHQVLESLTDLGFMNYGEGHAPRMLGLDDDREHIKRLTR